MTTNSIQRPSFYEGQILGAEDLARGVDYAREQDARHDRYLHSWGLAEGFEGKEQNGEWLLTPGYAIDSSGSPIISTQAIRLDVEVLANDVLPGQSDSKKWFPVFVVRVEMIEEPEPMLQQCGNPGSSRIREDAMVRFGIRADNWENQDPVHISDGTEDPPNASRIVLVGFVQWEYVVGTRGKIVEFRRRDPTSNVGPRYAGVQADDVIARGGQLALLSRQPKAEIGSSALIIGDHRTNEKQKKTVRCGLDDGKGNLNELLTLDPKGNLWIKGNLKAEGTLEGKLRKGDISIESGVASDGMPIPLPPGIDQKQIDDGSVSLHITVTPRLDRQADPVAITTDHVPVVIECSVDADRFISCVVKWYKLTEPTDQVDVAGTVDYMAVAYVNSEAGGAV